MGHSILRPLNLFERYFIYGLVGFAAEICFTAAFEIVVHGNRKLIGVSSIYVFFVYATAILAIERLYLRFNLTIPFLPLRGVIYTMICYSWEFTTGWLLKLVDACPWDYSSYFDYHFMGLITFEYLPVWFVATMACEQVAVRGCLSLALLTDEQTYDEVIASDAEVIRALTESNSMRIRPSDERTPQTSSRSTRTARVGAA